MGSPDHSIKPDVYYGARPEQLDEEIRENAEAKDDEKTQNKKLDKYIVPLIVRDRPIAPNFFVEAKGLSGSARVSLN